MDYENDAGSIWTTDKTANQLAASIMRARGKKTVDGKYVARMTWKQRDYLLSLADSSDEATGQVHMNVTGHDQQWGDAHNPLFDWHTAGLNLWATEAKPEPKTPCTECGHEWDDAATAEVCCTFQFSIDETTCCGCSCETCQSTPAPADEPEPSAEYKSALAISNAASRDFTKIQTDYRAGLIGDDVFLAARSLFMAAQQDFDEAYSRERAALDSTAPESDSSPTPPAEASTKGATTMAITDRYLPVGTKLVAKYLGTTYHAEVVQVDNAPRYRMTLAGETKDYKSPSAMGSAIMGVDKAGKPRTCNGWTFWSLDGGEQPAATPAPTGRTRRKKSDEPTTEPVVDPHAGLPIIQSIDGTFECGECGDNFPGTDDRDAVAAHIRESHPAYAKVEMAVA